MWYVYQFRSNTHLLYVGYTRYLKRRLGQHRRLKPWWPEVTEVRSEEFSTEDEARRREKELWADGQPKYNRHSPFLFGRQEGAVPVVLRLADGQPKYNRHSPFLTPEEERARHRALERRPDQLIRKRERAQAYGQTAAGRAVRAEYMRKFRRRQQTGPGLFCGRLDGGKLPDPGLHVPARRRWH